MTIQRRFAPISGRFETEQVAGFAGIYTLAAGSFLLLALIIPWQGFFVNLAATFVDILVTILYVDFIIKQHERGRWAQAAARPLII